MCLITFALISDAETDHQKTAFTQAKNGLQIRTPENNNSPEGSRESVTVYVFFSASIQAPALAVVLVLIRCCFKDES